MEKKFGSVKVVGFDGVSKTTFIADGGDIVVKGVFDTLDDCVVESYVYPTFKVGEERYMIMLSYPEDTLPLSLRLGDESVDSVESAHKYFGSVVETAKIYSFDVAEGKMVILDIYDQFSAMSIMYDKTGFPTRISSRYKVTGEFCDYDTYDLKEGGDAGRIIRTKGVWRHSPIVRVTF